VISLLIIALLLMKNIEDTFNRIWRVGNARPTLARVLMYWSVLTLGANLVGRQPCGFDLIARCWIGS
jgi:membrane protein